eukprot:1882799-Rhodomonas_salina.3
MIGLESWSSTSVASRLSPRRGLRSARLRSSGSELSGQRGPELCVQGLMPDRRDRAAEVGQRVGLPAPAEARGERVCGAEGVERRLACDAPPQAPTRVAATSTRRV